MLQLNELWLINILEVSLIISLMLTNVTKLLEKNDDIVKCYQTPLKINIDILK